MPSNKKTVTNKTQEATSSALPGVPYSPVQVVVMTIAIFFVSQFFAVLMISIYAGLRGWTSAYATSWSTTSVFAQFWTVLLIEGSVMVILSLLLRKRKTTLRTLGFVRVKVRDAGYALAGFAVYFPLLVVATQLLTRLVPSINVNQKQDLGFSTATSGWPLGLIFISLVILPPLVEEALFRGFLYGGLRGKLKPIPAALITSAMFALPHAFGNDSGTSLLWIAGVDTFLLSLVLVYLKEKTNSLWPGIFLHMLKNALAFASLFLFHLT